LLVARGFAVLKYPIPTLSDLREGEREGPRVVQRLDAAVQALDVAGLIDPSRVGLTGFSRAGYQAFYAVTHPRRTRLAAAIAADFFSATYSEYLLAGATGAGGANEFERVTSDAPFWLNREQWLAEEPSFNAHRVLTPLLYTQNGNGEVEHGERLRDIGALVLNRRPVEYLRFPLGGHNLQRPRERLAMLEATVDWMAFWILHEEDPDPGKADQYLRWRQMRDEWRVQQAWEAAGNPVGSTPAADFRLN